MNLNLDPKILSEPATKSIETVSKGLGTLYEPTLIVKEAGAKAQAALILAQGNIQKRELIQRAACYWVKGIEVASYRFEPHFRRNPQSSWFSATGQKLTVGGSIRRSKRHRTAIRGNDLNLATDFVPRRRDSWEAGDMVVPVAKLFMEKLRKHHPVLTIARAA